MGMKINRVKLINILLWTLYFICFTGIIWHKVIMANDYQLSKFGFDFWMQALEITLIVVAYLRNRFYKTAQNSIMLNMFFFSYLFKIIIMPWYLPLFILSLIPDDWGSIDLIPNF